MTEPTHSPKGASSAERWMNCPGSSHLLDRIGAPKTDEPEWTGLGIAAHQVCHWALQEDKDAWQYIGQPVGRFTVDAPMAEAVQVYLDYVREIINRPGTTWHTEARIGEDPETRPHRFFYGTVDLDAYHATFGLDIVDYKHGEGIIVEPEWNKQMLYYAYGRLFERRQRGVDLPPKTAVRLAIVQPRAFHQVSIIRTWETTVEDVLRWGDDFLLPAMEASESETEFKAGDWCRFCPAKLICPLLTGVYGAAAKADPKAIPNMSQERLGLEWSQRDAVKFYMNALDAEVLKRNMRGNKVPDTKLVWKRSYRILRDGAEPVIVASLGEEAYEPRKLKSPAELEKMSDAAKALVKEWSFFPKTGLTVAPASDKRTEVKAESSAETYAHILDNLPGND